MATDTLLDRIREYGKQCEKLGYLYREGTETDEKAEAEFQEQQGKVARSWNRICFMLGFQSTDDIEKLGPPS